MLELQHQRIHELCDQLKLDAIVQSYPELAAKAAANQLSFADFLESLLKSELTTCQRRSQQILCRTAGFPAIKTLEQFDFTAAHGVPKKVCKS